MKKPVVRSANVLLNSCRIAYQHFGKYKGATIVEIARKDLPYLKWMDENNIASGKTKAAIKEVLKHGR